jgi:putative transposase
VLEAVDQALRVGCPAIWNSDEGSHFTSSQYLGRLQERGIPISMDGKGRALDNIFTERLWRMVKYEEVQRAFYLKIPGVARRARGQQKMLPTLMGGERCSRRHEPSVMRRA